MHVSITGGLGFIGHNLGIMLRSMGHTVTAVDNLKFVTPELQDIRTRAGCYDEWINADICEHVDRIGKPNCVVHLASTPNQAAFKPNPRKAWQRSVTGNDNVIDYCAKNSIKLIFASSSMVYGNWTGAVSESSPTFPINPYGRMKLHGEWYLRQQSNAWTIIRPTAVYGPRDNTDRVITKWINLAKNNQPIVVDDVNASLDFTYVDDLCTAITNAITSSVRHTTFNVSGGCAVKLIDAAKKIVELCNSDSEIHFNNKLPYDMPLRGAMDISLAKKLLNYSPKYDLESGLKKLI